MLVAVPIGLVLVAVIGVAIFLRTEAGKAWVIAQIEELADPPRGTLHLGDLQTDLFSGATLTDITLSDDAGQPLVHVNRAEARWRLGSLPHLLVVPEVRIVGVYVIAHDTPDGLDLVEVWDDGSPPSTQRWSGLGLDVHIEKVAIEGLSGRYVRGEQAWGLDGATVRGAVALEGPAVLVRDLSLDAGATWPTLGALAIGGDLRWDPDTLWTNGLALDLGSNHLDLSGGLGRLSGDPTVGVTLRGVRVEPTTLAPLVGELPVRGSFTAEGAVNGPLGAPSATLDLQTPGGRVGVTARLDQSGVRPAWSGALTPHDVALDAFLPIPVPVVVSGSVTAEGAGLTWPDDLEGSAVFDLAAPTVERMHDLTARGAVSLSGGVATLSELEAKGLGGSVHGAGEVRILEKTGEVRIRRADLPLSALARFGVPDVRGRAEARGTGQFGWGDALGGTFDGTVRATGAGYAEVASVETVSGPAHARWSPEEGAHVEVDLGLETLRAPSTEGQRARLAGTADLTPEGELTASGTVEAEGVAAAGVAGDRVAATVELTRSAKGRLDGLATVETGPIAWQGWRSDHGRGRVRLGGTVLDANLDLFDGERTMIGFDGQVDVAARALRAQRVVAAPTEALAWRGEGVQTIRLVEGGVDDVRIRLASGPAWIEAEGRGRKKDLVNLRVEAHEVRVGWLAELLPAKFAGYGGVVSARASMEGHAKKPKMYLEVDARQMTVPGVVEGVDLALTGSDEDCLLEVDGQVAAGGRTLATFEGEAPFSLAIDEPGFKREGRLDLRVLVPPTDSAQIQAALPKVHLPTFRASAEVRLAGDVLAPELTVVASGTAPVGERQDWVAVDVDARTQGGKLVLTGGVRERMERRVLLSGDAELAVADAWRWLIAVDPDRVAEPDPRDWTGALAINLVPQRLGVQALGQFVDGLPASLRGEISGGIHIGGSVRSPAVTGAVFLTDGRLGDLTLSPALASIWPGEGGFEVEGILGFGTEGTIELTGFAPFAPGPDGLMAELAKPGLDLKVKAEAVPLQALAAAVPGMAATSGKLSADGTIKGSILDPAPDVGFAMKDGEFTLDQTGVRYSQVAFTGGLTHDEAHVEDIFVRTTRMNAMTPAATPANTSTDPAVAVNIIHGHLGITRPGSTREVELRKKGESEVVSAVLEHPLVEGELKFKKAVLLNLPDKQLQIDGRLGLNERGRKLHLGGRIVVIDGRLILPERFFTGGSDLALEPDVRVIRPGAVAREEAQGALAQIAAVASPDFVYPDWFDADVDVHLNHNAWLDATVPLEQMLGETFSTFSSIQARSVQLDGDLAVKVEKGKLSVEGDVRPERGTTTVLGRSFEIDGDSNSRISFTGQEFLDPVLDLQARYHPPSGDYGDILAKITGTPSAIEVALEPESSELAREDVLPVLLTGRPLNDLDASEQANIGSTLLSTIGGFLTNNARSQALDVLEFDATGNLRMGRRIGDRVFLIATFNLVDPDPTEENVVEATVEVQLGRKWRLDLTSGTSGISSASLDRRWRF